MAKMSAAQAENAMAKMRSELKLGGTKSITPAVSAKRSVKAHIDIDEKSNEIPAVQKLLEELDVAGHIITCDAMHCQKKPSKSRPPRTRI